MIGNQLVKKYFRLGVVLGVTMSGFLGFSGVSLAEVSEQAQALELVKSLYREHLGPKLDQANVFGNKAKMRKFFEDGLANNMDGEKLGFDPLIDGQDAEITDLKIYPDPELPALRGAYFVVVSFKNFGQPVKLTASVRLVLNEGRKLQILDLEGKDWSLSKMVAETMKKN